MNPNEASSTSLSSSSAFNVVIVYDEFRSGQQAVQTYQRLILERGEPAEVQLKTWTFDLLRNQRLNKAAVEDAAEAQAIILAAACEKVPSQVEKWFEGWCSRRGNSEAEMVVVLDSPVSEDTNLSPMENYLKRVATNVGCNLQIEKMDHPRNGHSSP